MCYDTLCLSGGGINGLKMLGSLKYLNDNNIIQMKKVNTFIGTSVGSLINLLLVLNYKINTIIKIIYKLDFSKIELDFDLDNFLENYGIDNASRILTIIQTQALCQSIISTFAQLRAYSLHKNGFSRRFFHP